MSRAACLDHPSEWWFPDEAPDNEQLARVRFVCADCPVRRECLDYALFQDRIGPPGGHGIWAGMSEGQRASLPRRVCLGCRRGEDPALLWDRMGHGRPTGVCPACDALRRRRRAARSTLSV